MIELTQEPTTYNDLRIVGILGSELITDTRILGVGWTSLIDDATVPTSIVVL